MATVMADRAGDKILQSIAEYAVNGKIESSEAYATARLCLLDTIGCGMLALKYSACTKLLGPVVPGTVVPNGVKIPGTDFALEPFRAAFNIGTMIRWLDFNDTWLAAEWGHPSDNLGGILSVSDYLCRSGKASLTVGDLLTAMIKAHEIQGVLALSNSFNKVGLDHVILVKVATAAVTCALLGGTTNDVASAVSQAWIDLGPLRVYRHAPDTGPRKSWAAGDATARGLQLAWLTMQGEKGYPGCLTSPNWGLYDVLFKGQPFTLERDFDAYVMENVLFKVQYPAEFHAQTAAEAAIALHKQLKGRLDNIKAIGIATQRAGVRIIDKTGPLKNPADRDHCLQYIVAIGLIYGELTADHYEEAVASDPRIDALRDKMIVKEYEPYTQDYYNANKRSIANAITIHMNDGTTLKPMVVEYPVGHRRRRAEATPLLFDKARENIASRIGDSRAGALIALIQDPSRLDTMPVSLFTDLLTGPPIR